MFLQAGPTRPRESTVSFPKGTAIFKVAGHYVKCERAKTRGKFVLVLREPEFAEAEGDPLRPLNAQAMVSIPEQSLHGNTKCVLLHRLRFRAGLG